MGLFDFAKDIGNKLFSNERDAVEKIKGHILANNPGIKDLFVIFRDGVATIIGVTESAEAAQKAVLIAGNVKGVTKVIPKIQINEPESAERVNAIKEDVAIDGLVNEGEVADADVDANTAKLLEPDNIEYYIIQSGDTLSKIAKKYYQDANQYPKIFAANKEVIKDPNLIYPGQKIRIPL